MIKPQPPLRPTASPGLSPSLVWDCFPSHSPRAALPADTGPLHLVHLLFLGPGQLEAQRALAWPLGPPSDVFTQPPPGWPVPGAAFRAVLAFRWLWGGGPVTAQAGTSCSCCCFHHGLGLSGTFCLRCSLGPVPHPLRWL